MADDIDIYLSTISDVNLTINTNDSILVSKQPNQGNNELILGALFTRGTGGELVNNSNKNNVINSNLSAATIISRESLINVTSLNILIIDKPTMYQNIDTSSNKTLASSVIVMDIKRNTTNSIATNVSLYLRVLDEYKPSVTPKYLCSFYDTTSFQWNESGCTSARFNESFNRYECSCNHLTSFALVWLPNVPITSNFNAQDTASLVFLSISIVSFLSIIVHVTVMRIRDPMMSLKASNLLSLISSGSTTILFIFYIALTMTVYTTTLSDSPTQCFLSSSVLMFFVYFFLIFMFCAKTSVGYFNYIRFVRLFPEPSLRSLLVMLIASFFISTAWVAFAAGFNSNASFKITQLYPFKICWFTRDLIHYFLTIPIGLFLLINVIVVILVGHRIFNHVRNSTSPHQSYERMKRCVLVLLASSITQGIGWLLGPSLTVVDEEAGNILGWFFNIFNGLEGLWSLLLYIILRSKHMDERKHVRATKKYIKPEGKRVDRYKSLDTVVNQTESDITLNKNPIYYRKKQNQEFHVSDDGYNSNNIEWPDQDTTMESSV